MVRRPPGRYRTARPGRGIQEVGDVHAVPVDAFQWWGRAVRRTRAGVAGRNGNTVGTYICADLACSTYIRLPKPTVAVAPEPGLDIDERIAGLLTRTAAFVDRVLN